MTSPIDAQIDCHPRGAPCTPVTYHPWPVACHPKARRAAQKCSKSFLQFNPRQSFAEAPMHTRAKSEVPAHLFAFYVKS